MSLYGYYREQAEQEFSTHLDGNKEFLICAVSASPLPAHAKDALTKSFEAFGYGPSPVSFLTLQAANSPHVGMVPDEGAPADSLDAKTLFRVIEAVDPVFLIACDSSSSTALKEAYRCSFPPLTLCKIFGRFACSFPNLANTLETDKGKQQVWALLKAFPRRN